MYDAGYYHELHDKASFFTDDNDALMMMNTYLDDLPFRNEEAEYALEHIRDNLIYKDKMVDMNEYMNDLLSKQKVMGDSEKFKEIVEFIKTNKQVGKKDLMDWLCWGRGIKWTPYRRALMNHPNIYDVNGSNPTYCWKD